MPNNNNNKKVAPRKQPTNHSFRGCREALLVVGSGGSGAGSTAYVAASGSTGAGRTAWVLAPVGLSTVTLASGLFNSGASLNVVSPPMRGLYGRAISFQWYRVTRAKFVFVSNQGSTIAGQITLSGYSDPMDVAVGTYAAQASGPNTRGFDLASAAGRELSIPVPIDSSWKKVSSVLTHPASAYPFALPSATGFVPCATAADLSFGAVGASWYGVNLNGVAELTNLGVFYLDYDVEFKGPIDSAINF